MYIEEGQRARKVHRARALPPRCCAGTKGNMTSCKLEQIPSSAALEALFAFITPVRLQTEPRGWSVVEWVALQQAGCD